MIKELLRHFEIGCQMERSPQLRNVIGAIISSAEAAGFDVLVTTDKNLQYQQNLRNRRIAIAVILKPAWPLLKQRAKDVASRILSMRPGDNDEM